MTERLPYSFSLRELVTASRCQWQFSCFFEHLVTGAAARIPFDWHADPLAQKIGELAAGWEKHLLEEFMAKPPAHRASRAVLDLAGRPREFHKDAFDVARTQKIPVVHDIFVRSRYGFYGSIPFLVRVKDGYRIDMPRFGAHVHPDSIIQLGFYILLARELVGEDVALSARIVLSGDEPAAVDATDAAKKASDVVDMVSMLVKRRLARGRQIDWHDVSLTCGHCWFCLQAIAEYDDVLGISGVGAKRREQFYAEGLQTVADIAALDPKHLPDFVDPAVHMQACAQNTQRRMRRDLGKPNFVYAQVRSDAGDDIFADAGLRLPTDGDVYLDFEIDNLRRGRPEDRYGLVYLTGIAGVGLAQDFVQAGCTHEGVFAAGRPDGKSPWDGFGEDGPDARGPRIQRLHPQPVWQATSIFPINEVGDFADLLNMDYLPLWAHDYEAEKSAFDSLVRMLAWRKKRFPSMRIYHYSHHERVLIKRLTKRHGLSGEAVEPLYRPRNIFSDLFESVKASIVTGQPGYSLKDLEPLYCGGIERGHAVAAAEDSIVAYNRLRKAMLRQQLGAHEDASISRLQTTLAMYNEYDCCSLALLHQWLIDFVSRNAARPAPAPAPAPARQAHVQPPALAHAKT